MENEQTIHSQWSSWALVTARGGTTGKDPCSLRSVQQGARSYLYVLMEDSHEDPVLQVVAPPPRGQLALSSLIMGGGGVKL